MSLSRVERIILANQYKILSLLEDGYTGEYDNLIEALEHGFESYYSEALLHIADEEVLTKEESRLVIDALDLHWALQVSYKNLEDEEKAEIDEKQLDCPGFDGNNETKLYVYARFVVEKEQRFSMLRFEKDSVYSAEPPAPNDRYNSHMPMIDVYSKRIEHWKSQNNRYELSVETIQAILDTV